LITFNLLAQELATNDSYFPLRPSLGTVENHGNMEIMESVIFVKCCDFAKMPYFAVLLAKMPRFRTFHNNFVFVISTS